MSHGPWAMRELDVWSEEQSGEEGQSTTAGRRRQERHKASMYYTWAWGCTFAV
jgi:hypothetical protein